MSKRRTSWILGGAAALGLLALAGCASAGGPTTAATSSPTVTASSTPVSSTPAPEPTPESPATLVLGGESAVLTDNGSTLGDFVYGGPADVLVSSLTSILGQPETVVHQGEKCVNDSVDSVWGGLTVSYWGMDASTSPQVQFSVRGEAPGLVVETSNGARVGGSWPEFAAAIPGAPTTTGEYEGKTWVEVIDGNYSAWGPTAGTLVNTGDSSVIDFIVAPLDLGHDC